MDIRKSSGRLANLQIICLGFKHAPVFTSLKKTNSSSNHVLQTAEYPLVGDVIKRRRLLASKSHSLEATTQYNKEEKMKSRYQWCRSWSEHWGLWPTNWESGSGRLLVQHLRSQSRGAQSYRQLRYCASGLTMAKIRIWNCVPASVVRMTLVLSRFENNFIYLYLRYVPVDDVFLNIFILGWEIISNLKTKHLRVFYHVD